MNESDEAQWFALRATYGRNIMARDALSKHGVQTFVPMRFSRRLIARRGTPPKLEPVVRDLIFVFAPRRRVQELKTGIPYLQYIMHDTAAGRVPIIVPERQMNDFIAVCGTMDEHLVYLSAVEMGLRRGDRVRIIAGQFAGMEGILMKLPRRRSLGVVVSIQGVIAVAIVKLHPSCIEPVK